MFRARPALCKIAEAARYLGVTPHVVRSMVRRGDLASIRLGRLLFVKWSDIEYIASGVPDGTIEGSKRDDGTTEDPDSD